MLTNFQNSFTDTLSGKFAIKIYLNIPAHLRYVATLPCSKNRIAEEVTEANCHKTVLKYLTRKIFII